jgi:hypothetical protein
VLPKVSEHVQNRISHFPRRTERTPVPAIRPKLPAPREQIVHVARDAHGDAANPTRERTLVSRLYDEVHVIALHREMNEAKSLRITASSPR